MVDRSPLFAARGRLGFLGPLFEVNLVSRGPSPLGAFLSRVWGPVLEWSCALSVLYWGVFGWCSIVVL